MFIIKFSRIWTSTAGTNVQNIRERLSCFSYQVTCQIPGFWGDDVLDTGHNIHSSNEQENLDKGFQATYIASSFYCGRSQSKCIHSHWNRIAAHTTLHLPHKLHSTTNQHHRILVSLPHHPMSFFKQILITVLLDPFDLLLIKFTRISSLYHLPLQFNNSQLMFLKDLKFCKFWSAKFVSE